MKKFSIMLGCAVFLMRIGLNGAQPVLDSQNASTTTLMPAIPILWGHSWGISARDMGMGGAFSAVCGDNSSLYYNPAGLGLIRHKEISGTLSRSSISNTANFLGLDNTEESNIMNLNSLGFSFPLPTSRGSIVFGFGYHRVRQFDNVLYASKFIASSGDSVTWNNSRTNKGSMSNTSLGGSMEMAPGVFLGAAIQFWGGKDDFSWLFQELDTYNLYTFSQFDSTDHILTSFSGANLSLGVLCRSKYVRFGGTISTPFVLKSTENWDYRDKTQWDPDINTESEAVSDEGTYEYKIYIPLAFRAGAALTYGPVLVSGDVEILNMNQLEYRTDPSIESLDQTMANLAIQRNLRNIINTHYGCELSVPGTSAKLRAGCANIMTPYKNIPYEKDRTVYSFGAGYLFGERAAVDVAYAFTKWEGAPDNLIWKDSVKANQVFVSVSFKM
jgi:hypothetical protein